MLDAMESYISHAQADSERAVFGAIFLIAESESEADEEGSDPVGTPRGIQEHRD